MLNPRLREEATIADLRARWAERPNLRVEQV